jgi:hypothetical protein
MSLKILYVHSSHSRSTLHLRTAPSFVTVAFIKLIGVRQFYAMATRKRVTTVLNATYSALPDGLVVNTRQQAIAETPAKRSAYQIPSVIVVFMLVVCKSRSQKPREALNPSVREERY